MRSTIRKGATAVAGACFAAITLIGTPGTAVAGGVQPPEATAGAAKYVAYLEDRAQAGDAEANDIATQFKALSVQDQLQFLALISDTKTTQAYTQAVSEVGDEVTDTPPAPGSFTKALGAGHEVETVTETGETEPQARNSARTAAASYKDMWASYSVYDKVLGIKVTKVTVRTNYQVKGKDTTKVYPGSASHYNYVPAASFSHSPVKEWISSPPADNAQTETVWTATWTGGLGSWSARERVWADYRGFVGGYLK
ncbi:hypothetical protein QFZ63_005122 [Streptomyces sp. B3I7]|uniref:hypothetical protein n=1 Tax=Streptomyces sp. B3I7 TaxID=3042269 RepID=UPI00278BA4E5|nr:hypothetical protein [Streptomyces sp. B3I7]MDQ0813408.1 hypothetical protein [Streptomyces sp. B3I7]